MDYKPLATWDGHPNRQREGAKVDLVRKNLDS